MIAIVLSTTLSAPALSISLISSIDLMPPPTVNGIEIHLAVFFIVFNMLFLPYKLATTSE